MVINRSTIEQIAWYVVAVIVIAAVAVGVMVYNQNRQIQRTITSAQHDRDLQLQATQGYIKCILLLRYDHPELNDKSSKNDVSNALDECARKE